MKRRSMRSREFWDERQLSLFDYNQEKKGRDRRRKPKEHRHDSPIAMEKDLYRGGVRVAFERQYAQVVT